MKTGRRRHCIHPEQLPWGPHGEDCVRRFCGAEWGWSAWRIVDSCKHASCCLPAHIICRYVHGPSRRRLRSTPSPPMSTRNVSSIKRPHRTKLTTIQVHPGQLYVCPQATYNLTEYRLSVICGLDLTLTKCIRFHIPLLNPINNLCMANLTNSCYIYLNTRW